MLGHKRTVDSECYNILPITVVWFQSINYTNILLHSVFAYMASVNLIIYHLKHTLVKLELRSEEMQK